METFTFNLSKPDVKKAQRREKTVARQRWESLQECWDKYVEATRIIEMRAVLKLYEACDEKPPKELLILLATYLSGRFELRPPIKVAKLRKKVANVEA